MTQSEVRRKFVQNNPGVRRRGRGGYWYRCAHCGKWCGRPGTEKAYIKDEEKMEVDHILPWDRGGSDEMYNLQPLCKPCNRSKSNGTTFKDELKIMKNNVTHLDFVGSTVRKGARHNPILKGLGITKRR